MSALPPSEPVSAGRAAAALALADALTGRRFVTEALREFRTTGELQGREAALAMELAQGAVRNVYTIEHVLGVLARFNRSRTPALVRAILYTAVYQLLWLHRIPPFAAVDEAVKLARRLARGRTPALVNAVLRRVTAALVERRVPWQRLDATQVRVNWGQACRFGVAVLPDATHDLGLHLAAATGERAARYAALEARHGRDLAEAVAWASRAIPPIVGQRNPLRSVAAEWTEALQQAVPEAEICGDTAYLPASAAVAELPLFATGQMFVQDTTAHAAALAVGAQPGERVLDLCAAPGGKSLVLALQMQDRGEVLACDNSAERLLHVHENVARLGLTCVREHVLGSDASVADFGAGLFDAALVDAPCSNTGVIARRPEARLGLTSQKLRSLVTTQRELIVRAAAGVRPGGRLVYSTCSIEPTENEEVVHWFLVGNTGWRLEQQETTLPTWGARRLQWRDGGYYARMCH
jgi:16S rRNA (cytosine967-C5)-methyltransferase